jgi:hypothetical protein
MSEALGPHPQERRSADRRAEPDATRRAPKPSRWARWMGIAGRDAAIVVVTLATIIFSVRHMNPIFAGQPSVAQSLASKGGALAKAALPTTTSPLANSEDTTAIGRLVKTPEFERDRKAFAADLVATGRMSQPRADSISFYAVREAYVNGIPPAVIFGVMLTENAQFVSHAMSNVGAVGLMQVYPKVWLKALKDKFGSDLASDSTNLKYGIFILKQYVKSDSGAVTSASLAKGLLRYNGCVRGTNTPHCHNYPTKVKTYVEKSNGAICADKSFYDCIARPFLAGLFGKREEAVDVAQAKVQ